MIYYDLPASPNARRVRILMAEKGLNIPTETVDMMTGENQKPEYLAKNSLGTMPLLELDDGSFLAESGAICRYLDELNPEPPLFGRDPQERAMVEMWHRRMELEILVPVMAIFVHTHPMWIGRVTQVPDWGEVSREKLATRMAWLDREIEGRQYIAGDDYTVADIVGQAAFVMAKAGLKLPIPEDLKNLTDWFERVSSRPSARA